MTELQDPNIFRMVLDSLQTGVYLLGRDGKIRFWNDGAERITGYRRHEVIGRSCSENILAPCNQQRCVLCGDSCPLTATLAEGKASPALLFFCHKAGHRVPVQVWSVPIRGDKGLLGIAESFDEQSSCAEPESHQNHLAAHGCLDMTSGVMNQGLTRSYLREHLAFFAEYDLRFGVVSIRIEELKQLGASRGHEAADDVVRVVAETIKRALGTSGFLGRWTDDQFLVIVPNCDSAELKRSSDNFETIVNSAEIKWWGDVLSITVAVGRAMVQAGDTLGLLLERAQPQLPSREPPSAAMNSKC